MRTRRARWTAHALASPAERGTAFLIDAGIFWVVWVAGVVWLAEVGELGPAPRPWAPRALLWAGIVVAGWWAYDALGVATWGGTVGRGLVGIEVRDREGGLPTRGAAWRRTVARTGGLVALGAGLRPLWRSAERRAHHDRVAGTVVVRTGCLEPAGDSPGGRTDGAATDDATELAIRAGAPSAAVAGWLRAIAEQTTVRLDVAAPSWRRGDDPGRTRDRAFCLLLAALLPVHADHRGALVAVITAHPALSDVRRSRVGFLIDLVADPARARRWLGVPATTNVALLLDTSAGPGTSARPGGPAGQVAVRSRR